MVENKLELILALDKKHVTIRHYPEENLIWNEWKGAVPSEQLREAIMFACNFILEHDEELILADYTQMSAPTVEDQVWIATYSAELLQHSKLRKMANLMNQDIFQQIAIENIYERASELPLPCETREFVSEEEAVEWFLSD